MSIDHVKRAFLVQLEPNCSNTERLDSYNVIQSFKASRDGQQLKTIFQLLSDPNDFIRTSTLGLFYDVLRVEWNNYSNSEKQEVKSSLISHLRTEKNVPRQMTRIIAEVAIREWPQEWDNLTELFFKGDPSYFISILRVCGEIQFNVNHQTIDNTTRHRDLSTALAKLHHRLIECVLAVCSSNDRSIKEKDEVLANAGLLVESCTHEILLELVKVKQLWALLKDSIGLIGTPDSNICLTLFEIFIVSVSRQVTSSSERVDLWVVFSSDDHLEIIELVLDRALQFSTEKEFQLCGRLAQFCDSMGGLIASCWYSHKNCEHDAIKSLSQCGEAVSFLIKVVSLKSPFLVQSAILAFQNIIKAISTFLDPATFSGDTSSLKAELSKFVQLLVPKLVSSLSYFASDQFTNQDSVRFLQAFESVAHQRSFVTKLINSSCALLKCLTRLVPVDIGRLLSQIIQVAIQDTTYASRRIAICATAAVSPVIAQVVRVNQTIDFASTSLADVLLQLLKFTPKNNEDLKFKIELLRGFMELLGLLPANVTVASVECLLALCEGITGEDNFSAKMRRQSASALVHLTSHNSNIMEPLFEMIHNTAAKWQSSKLHVGPRVLLFEVLVMLCWLPERQHLLPMLLTELLSAVTSMFDQTSPAIDDITSPKEFAEALGLHLPTPDQILQEDHIFTSNRSSLTSAVALLLVVLRRCKVGSGNNGNEAVKKALSVGAPCLLKVLRVYFFFQHLYSESSLSNASKEALDTETQDWAQVNQTDSAYDSSGEKREPHTRLRSVLENMQQQLQLVIANGAKVWPDLYNMPNLYEMLAVKTLPQLPCTRQRLVIRQLLGPFVQHCPGSNVDLGVQTVADVVNCCVSQLNQNWHKIEVADFDNEKDEMLHYYRTQTMTKDFIEFLTLVLRTSVNKSSLVAEQMIKSNVKVLLKGICSPLNWLCAKTMQKSCSIMQTLLSSLDQEQNFDTDLQGECLISVLKAFSIHGEHSECISPLTQIGFTLFKMRKEIFVKILEQIPRVDHEAIKTMIKMIKEGKMKEAKQRLKFKEICQPLFKKPISEEGKLQLTISSLPPLFNRKSRKWNRFSEGNSSEFDVNWISLENI